jgi:hypothetical protein
METERRTMDLELRVSLGLGLRLWLDNLQSRLERLQVEVRDVDRLRLLLSAQAVGRLESGEDNQMAVKRLLMAVNAWDHAAEGPRGRWLV